MRVHTHLRTQNLMRLQCEWASTWVWIFARDLDAGDAKVVEQRRNLRGIEIELEKQLGLGGLLCMHKRV